MMEEGARREPVRVNKVDVTFVNLLGSDLLSMIEIENDITKTPLLQEEILFLQVLAQLQGY